MDFMSSNVGVAAAFESIDICGDFVKSLRDSSVLASFPRTNNT